MKRHLIEIIVIILVVLMNGNNSPIVMIMFLIKENIGKSLCIDETALSDGELYTIGRNSQK